MGIAQRPHRQLRIGVEKGIEIRIPRPAGDCGRLARILGSQRRHPAHHKRQALLLDPDLLGLHGLQGTAGQRAGAAGVDGLHQGTLGHGTLLLFRGYQVFQTGGRFSMKASMPSAASSSIMLQAITSAA